MGKRILFYREILFVLLFRLFGGFRNPEKFGESHQVAFSSLIHQVIH